MKTGIYLLLISFCLLLGSCSKNNNDSTTSIEFAGSWSGTYSGDETGTWTATISESGVVTGTAKESSTSYQSQLNGTVTSDGAFTATVGTTSQGYKFDGQINGSTVSGTWNNSATNHSGNWSGNKQ